MSCIVIAASRKPAFFARAFEVGQPLGFGEVGEVKMKGLTVLKASNSVSFEPRQCCRLARRYSPDTEKIFGGQKKQLTALTVAFGERSV